MTIDFQSLPLSPATLQALQAMSYVQATPVQKDSIPAALNGQDLMVQSQTGTGKTAAFAIPVIEQLSQQKKIKNGSVLILAPTRELARQVKQEVERLISFHQLKVTAIYGGVSFDDQVQEIKNSHILVGTPGRIVDHIKRKTLSLKNIRHFVLDEVDEMLSMGFAEDLDFVTKKLPEDRQTLFF